MLFQEWDQFRMLPDCDSSFPNHMVKNHNGSLLYYFSLRNQDDRIWCHYLRRRRSFWRVVDGGWNVSWRSGQEVLVREVFKKVRRVLWSLCHFDSHQVTGGNWRTRHLKMRSSYARQAVMRVAGRTQGWRGYDYRHWNEGIGIPTI